MKRVFIVVGLIAVVAAAFFFLHGPSVPAPVVVSDSPTPIDRSFTLADVAQHKDASSCYAAINGSVYDLTAWIDQHPGGPEHILSICGTDATDAFNAQHGGQARPESELATFRIGTLVR
ncbi:MAG TPA: cytochrome b5-like heme/steroid binding domain-containing protein [Candidatus Paceibacterota bacterium]|nr:cytochrome b5-like heme/steroid binding domain-containing protein [Candidatus Paceibacterota bacterium]